MILQCIFMPRTKRFICAPAKNQSAQIAREKILEIYQLFPLLRREIVGGEISSTPGNFGKDYVTLKFRNGSILDVVGAIDSTRGGRRHGGLIDEIRKIVSKKFTFIDETSLISEVSKNEMLYLFYYK